MLAEVRVIDNNNPDKRPYLISECNFRIEGCVKVYEFKFEYCVWTDELNNDGKEVIK